MKARSRSSAATIAVALLCSLCLAHAAGHAAQSVVSSLAASPQTASNARSIPPPESRVDINHASVDQLLKVRGITASWAGRIVRFRPYRTKQDLLDRGVLPSDVYDRIKDSVIAHHDKQ